MAHLIISIRYFEQILQLLILVRIVLSFIIRDPYNKIYRIVHQLTDPILAPFRNLINKLGIKTGMFDFSPILALFTIRILTDLIIRILVYFNYVG